MAVGGLVPRKVAQMDALRTGKVQTVGGLIEPEQMGITLMHEHLLCDLSCRFEPHPEASRIVFGQARFSPELRTDILYDAFGNLDNTMILDEQESIEEVMRFKLAGGGTIVDTTTLGLARDPLALRRISAATGLHVSMGAGYYVHLSHPSDMDERSEEQIYEEIVRDVEVGVGDTGIRCGHIGEIGVDQQTPNEMKVVRAAARAQRRTGAMLNIHQLYVAGQRTGHAIADAIEQSGGSLRRTVFSHMDGSEADLDYQVSLLDRGLTLEYDLFGLEIYMPRYELAMPSDASRVNGIAQLIEAGWIDQITISHDSCMKIMRVKYGGWGYAHILNRILPRFRKAGVTDGQIEAIMVDNPRRLLPFVSSQI